MLELFRKFEKYKSNYNVNHLDLRKPVYAKVLMYNFPTYRKDSFDKISFNKNLKTTLSRLRK